MAGSIVVLHVDDDSDLADLVATFLEKNDDAITVETAASAEAGLHHLESSEVDCIFSDYEMPGQNGLEFLDAVRSRDEEIPFVLFTGKGSEEIASKAITAGVSDYLQKTVGTDQYEVLANRIRNLVTQHRAERRVDRALAAIETARDGIALFDEADRFVYVNGAYADFYGYDAEDLAGETWDGLYPEREADRYLREIEPALRERGNWTGECVAIRADGTRFRSTHSLTQLEDGGHVCLIHHGSVREE